jgi:hypothetical protein
MKSPNLWVEQTAKNVKNDVYKRPKEIEVTWGDNKSCHFIDFPQTKGHRWVNSQIIEKLCIDSNLLMEYISFLREKSMANDLEAEQILTDYMRFLDDKRAIKDDQGHYKVGATCHYYMKDELHLPPKKSKGVRVR